MGTNHVTEETRSEICKILGWDFKQMESGSYSFVSHNGHFHPSDSKREKLAGESLSVKAAPGLHVSLYRHMLRGESFR